METWDNGRSQRKNTFFCRLELHFLGCSGELLTLEDVKLMLPVGRRTIYSVHVATLNNKLSAFTSNWASNYSVCRPQSTTRRARKLLHLFTGYKTCYIMCSLWNHHHHHRWLKKKTFPTSILDGYVKVYVFFSCFIFTLSLANYPRRQLNISTLKSFSFYINTSKFNCATSKKLNYKQEKTPRSCYFLSVAKFHLFKVLKRQKKWRKRKLCSLIKTQHFCSRNCFFSWSEAARNE